MSDKNSMINKEMLQEIKNKLKDIEQTYQVKIVYACESGSRAWGFPSMDSDYDVRFIYTLLKEEYLSIENKKDTIDIPINEVLDMNGWELRKSFRLFYNSNPVLYEWFQSPIVYYQNELFLKEIKVLMPEYFSFRKGMHHYLGMANNAWAELQANQVRIKKYFYCLRPLLAARWILDRKEVPPMEFTILRTQVKNKEWQHAVDDLLVLKLQATEKTRITPISVLNKFIEEELAYCKQNVPDMNDRETDIEPLNTLFRKLII